MRRLFFLIGVVLIASAGLWHLKLNQHWTQRLPPGWRWQTTFIGVLSSPNPETGTFPDRDTTSIYWRTIEIISETSRPQSILLEDTYTVLDPNTDEITYEYIYQAPVDPQSGQHLLPEYRGDYFVFPRQVAKKSYSLRSSYLEGVTVSFQKEETVEGIETYLFAYKGRGEYTASYAGTAEYPGVPVEPGQEIRCADDQFIYKVWGEPLTGEALKMEESCYAGDYLYEISSGKRLSPILRWGGVIAGDDLLQRAKIIHRERVKYLWAARYFPALLFSFGLICLGWGSLSGGSLKNRFKEDQ